MKFAHLIFVLSGFIILHDVESFKAMGPIGKIIVNSIYECSGNEKPKVDDFNTKVELVKDGDHKALDITVDSKIDMDDSLYYEVIIKKNENGSWKNFYNVKGQPCKDFDRYINKLWAKLTNATIPKLEKACPVPPGSYKISNFKASTADMEIKSFFYGLMLVKISVDGTNGQRLFCLMGEANFQAP